MTSIRSLTEDAINEAHHRHIKAVRPSTNTPEDNEYEALTEGFSAGIKFAREILKEAVDG